jgi:hypothetical protein
MKGYFQQKILVTSISFHILSIHDIIFSQKQLQKKSTKKITKKIFNKKKPTNNSVLILAGEKYARERINRQARQQSPSNSSSISSKALAIIDSTNCC